LLVRVARRSLASGRCRAWGEVPAVISTGIDSPAPSWKSISTANGSPPTS